ncbi:MAG TPA: succinyl-diaminopimelate desuccinylase [Acidimicrobiales bacterium]|nr:succinyl-diaminopimelate desuccinylase [Acidimicrobiales bacterium]
MSGDLVALTASLVDIPSVSHNEAAMADYVENWLSAIPTLSVTRVGDNLVARTELGRPQRLLLAGHLDTVPAAGNEKARVDGDVLWGLGSVDMKSGVAVMLELARSIAEPTVDVTYVFYVCEEVDFHSNGLEQLFTERADLLECDAAVLTEPTGARVEAGCQGTMRVDVVMEGRRAHAARSWLGRNAIHRLADVLAKLSEYEGRVVVIDGCEFHEGLSAVLIDGGVAGNVIPDRATLTLNHRFAPDRTPAQAEAHVREIVGAVDGFDVIDFALSAPPALGHPLLTSLLEAAGGVPEAKLGWTDVSRFAARGVPATNFGPGDPNLAHAPDERVTRSDLEEVWRVLVKLLQKGVPANPQKPAKM